MCLYQYVYTLLVSLILSSSAFAAKPLIAVLDLDRTFVQQVPERNLSQLNQKNIVRVNNKVFYVADYTATVLARLSLNPHIEAVISSEDFSQDDIKGILKSIPSPLDKDKNLFDSIAIIDPDTVEKLNLQKTFIITGTDPRWRDSKQLIVPIMPIFFQYESPQLAEKALAEASPLYKDQHASQFPVDEDSFTNHKKRMLGLYAFLNKIANDSSKGLKLADALSKHNGLNFSAFIVDGENLLNNEVGWVVATNKVTACELKLSNESSVKAPLSICRETLPIRFDWKNTADGGRSCFSLTKNNQVIVEEEFQNCSPDLKTYALWTNYEQKKCAIFTEDLTYLKKASEEDCSYNVQYDPIKKELSKFSINSDGSTKWENLEKLSDYGFNSGPRGSFSRSASFASLLLHDPTAYALLRDRMPKGCADELKKLYASGETLYSEKLETRATNILDVPYYSGQKDTLFYHWTNSESVATFATLFHREITERDIAHKKSLKEDSYEKIFKYLRATPVRRKNTATPNSNSLWSSVFYMAEDPKSSSGYGTNLITFEFQDNAKVLDYLSPAWIDALQELNQKYPSVTSACHLTLPPQNDESYGCGVNQAPIYFIVAEDSNIDLIDYYSCGANYRHQFFQLLSPKKIKQIRFSQ
jgi:hypothetical protein